MDIPLLSNKQSDQALGKVLLNEADKTPGMLDISKALALINAGATLNESNEHGNTPLILGALYHQTQLCIALINHGADVDRQNKSGMSALMWAAFFGYEDIVVPLIQAGARLDGKDKDNDTALNMARQNGRKTIVKLIEDAQQQRHQVALQQAENAKARSQEKVQRDIDALKKHAQGKRFKI